MIELTINGDKKEFPEGKTLLECIQDVGIKVPTLCHHKALKPYGACRLCLVEVEQGGRAPSIQASCCYPALDGLSVKTNTERVEKARKIVIELLLARCPDSEVVQKLAADLGVKEVRIKKKDDDCIYCGLCVRMCEERMGRSAVGIIGRGPRRQVESPFAKNSEECWVCQACDFICPTGKTISTSSSDKTSRPIPDEFNLGLNTRSSVYLMYPQMIPNKPVIDKNTCVHLNYDKCGVCKEICEAEAINYEDEDKTVELDVGAVILTPGYEVYDATASEEYGYGRYPNVINSIQFERILSASGPFEGHVQRPYDKKTPERIAFIQCVGSRDSERDYCSAVCCMYATKEAVIAKEHGGEQLACDIYFMDLRAFGKGFEEYYQRAKEQGVNYIRCRPPTVKEIPETRNLIIEYLTEDDRKVSQEYDMVVLAIGIQPPRSVNDIAGRFQIGLNQFNFCKTSAFNPAESSRDGIYVAGAFTEPKDIPDTVMQASAAASNALSLLSDVRGSLIKPEVYPPEKDVKGQEPRVGVFVCHCGVNIASVVNVPDVVEYAKTLPDIVFAQNNLYTCSGDSCENIKNMIKEHDLNRVIVASCTPRTHEPLFRSVLQEAGLNPYLFEMANIRDQCSWVHMHEPERATKKSKDLVRMAVAKARSLEPLYKGKISINRSALVIGGGLAGMTAALQIANQGFEAYLVEKEIELGGNLRRIHYLLNGENPQKQLESLIAKVKGNSRIHLFTNAVINSIEGSIGKFKTGITVNGQDTGTNQEIEHGVVIVATGAKEYRPEEYLYGEDERVITQLELEERLIGSSEPGTEKQKPKTIVMIQCVGSRDDQRPYCSKVCCTEAVKNALKIKETAPDTSVYILYRDIRTYGFKESYYTKAREEGIAFIRYDEDRKPEVSRNGTSLQVKVFDQVLKMRIKIPADLVVLSAGTVAEHGNEAVAQLLKVPLTPDKFFLEAHMKLRPVDFATEGVFLCGLAHSAKSIEESIIQAQASAARASTIISKDTIELEANISYVVDENCDGCAYCIDPCPYKALTLIEYMRKGAIKKTVETNESLCKGCGTCMATCPKKGIFVKGFKLEQIGAQVEAMLEPVE
ncbi:MAG: FAD-dependent oxidoreductase [Candidatus Aminicenantes bacterium]|nr:FAD-dependent oxidoreductase [Candidatus Aminicenantes bacterium]NIM80679.1 FAD-dependent oxidoreductase [Candidatus Aminicenantes bacterium]NIN20056.1 FAD-dependent oxidoreductase [Candidatus Aminicenantes bacterium]NIN43843.1 FAD-dependent oxidoreductase [Candidatus Aminicenantes bacterium]NIN86654.1 FAD-dependent oxidoreductase [Candidatus Aminicenantes bacterium]